MAKTGPKPKPILERFWAKVEKIDSCWLWRGYINPKGYGRLSSVGRCDYAHRLAYELLVGPIPEGLQLDHLCRNRACVNPEHLEPVTNLVNSHRGLGGRHNLIKTHCPKGHPYDEENTFILNERGWRSCRTCARERGRAKAASPGRRDG